MAKKSTSSSAAAKAAENAGMAPLAPTTPNSIKSTSGGLSYNQLGQNLYKTYITSSSKRIKLIDCFLIFLVLLGIFQFAFCLVVGTFPFNAFLGGFGATVGQFVLLASLRIQINENNYGQFKAVSPERYVLLLLSLLPLFCMQLWWSIRRFTNISIRFRAFGDFVFGSLILHFIVYHFIN